MTPSPYWRDLQRQRVSRRRLLAASGAGAAGLALAAACGSDGSDAEPEATSPPSGKPQYGGRFLAATSAVIDTIDPHLSIAAGTAYFPRIYNLLVARSPLQPDFFFYDLAESYEHPDETTWVFQIRPGVTIAPNDVGVPERDMDAMDVYESFERIKSMPAANANGFVSNWFASHEASADGMTYTIINPSPYAWFIDNIGQFPAMTPPRELIAGDVEALRTSGVGGGALFAPVGGYTEGERLVMNRNPNYYRTDPSNNDAQLPYIDGFDVTIIGDRAGLRTSFLSKQAYSYLAESEEEANDITSNYDVHVQSNEPVFWFISVTMNVERPPFDDPTIRKAVMHSVNRQQYVDLIYGGDAQANGLVHWPVGEYALPPEELDVLQKFDPELSKELIQQAGYDLPLRVPCIFPANSELLEHDAHVPIFIEQMQAAGFDVQQDPQDLGTWIESYTNIDYAMSLSLNQIYETPETPLAFQHSDGPFGDGIYSKGLQNPAIDAELDRIKTITDHDELVEAIHDVQRQIYEVGPMFLPLVSAFSRALYWDFVKNFPSGIGQTERLLHDWWLEL